MKLSPACMSSPAQREECLAGMQSNSDFRRQNNGHEELLTQAGCEILFLHDGPAQSIHAPFSPFLPK